MGGVPLGYPPDIHEDLTSKPGPRKPQPWERILNRKDRPNIGVGLLTLPDGNQTGFQISPRHVVTAAHGLVEHGDNVVEVDPAGVSYFDPEKGSSIQACRVLVAQEYHDLWNADLPDGRYREWDFSVVTLEEPLNTEFWFGLFAAPDSLLEGYMEDVFIYERGFPECEDECAPPGCDDGMSASMFGSGFSCTAWDEPPSDGETSRFRIVKCPVNHRMSGGPLYIVWNNQAYAVGLHSAITPLPDGADSYCEAWPMFFSSTTLARILAFRRDCGGIGG